MFELRQELEGAARTSIMKELENDYKAQVRPIPNNKHH